jgi:formylglycine-generating enzyme required for sulfatase activity
MVYIPAGEFIMGSDEGETDEGPAHEVYLDAYWIDQTEITNDKYALCVDAGSCNPPLESGSYTRTKYYDDVRFADYPVIFVDWDMANAYCQWAGARLPSEAEWEKAARGENGIIYPWGNEWDVKSRKRLNFADNSNPEMASDLSVDDGHRDTAPVGSYLAGQSPYGIYDLAGNVWEWVADWYDPQYHLKSQQNNPLGPTDPVQDPPLRAMRGGAWVAANENVFHTYNRHGVEPSEYSSSIGLRCALSTGAP